MKKIFYKIFNNKSNDITSFVENEYILTTEQCKFHYSSNMVIEFEHRNGNHLFFRMCRRMPKRKSFKMFIYETLDLFFRFIHIDNLENVLVLAINDINMKKNLDLLKKIHIFYFNHFEEMCSSKLPDFSSIGFPSLNGVDFKGEHIHFLQFLRGSIDDFKRNHHIKCGKYFNNSANRILATSKLSHFFSMETVIPESYIAKVIIDGYIYYGTVMLECKGSAPAYITPDKRVPFNYNFAKNLLTLEYFDFICYQTDRRIDNYNVVKVNGVVSQISAFDNDCPTTFLALPFLPKQMSVFVSALLNENSINRPFMDKHFYYQLLAVTYGKINDLTKKYLNVFQRLCLYLRCKTVKKAAIISSNDPNFFCYKYNDYKFKSTYLDVYLNDTSLIERIEKYGG